MSVQIRRRRESAAFLSTFTGAQGELIVDTTNNRVQVHDGVTQGGWPAARLDEVAPATKLTSLADSSYAIVATDGVVVLTIALTAPRTLTLPAASSVKPGKSIRIVDQAGGVSRTNTLSVAAAGSDRINGAATAVFTAAFTDVPIVSDGVARWTYDVQGIARGGTGATSVAGALAGLGLTTRTTVADAAYAIAASDRLVAVTGLTAARVLTLPAASGFPTGLPLLVVDESGQCGATRTLTIARAGSDTLNGGASAVLATPYGFLALESDSVSKWTIIDQSTGSLAQQAASAVAITGGSIAGTPISGASGTFTALNLSGTAISSGATPLLILDKTASGGQNVIYGRTAGSLRWVLRLGNATSEAGANAGSDVNLAAYDDTGALLVNALTVTRANGLVTLSSLSVTGATTFGAAAGLKGTTVGAVPAGTAGQLIYVSNARKVGEAAGSGTGTVAYYSGGAWRRLSDDTAVAA